MYANLHASNPKLKIAVNLTSEHASVNVTNAEEEKAAFSIQTSRKANPQTAQLSTHILSDSSYQDVSQIFKSKEEFIFVFGGFSANGFLNSVEVLDVKRGIWRHFKEVI